MKKSRPEGWWKKYYDDLNPDPVERQLDRIRYMNEKKFSFNDEMVSYLRGDIIHKLQKLKVRYPVQVIKDAGLWWG